MNTLSTDRGIDPNEITKELKEIKKELKALNQNLGEITKMIQDYMLHIGVYIDPRNI